MASSTLRLLLGFAALAMARRTHQQMMHRANSVRKVVETLKDIRSKIAEEGHEQKRIHHKHRRYCRAEDKRLVANIADANASIPELTADIRAAEKLKSIIEEAVKDAKTSRMNAVASIREKKIRREREADTYVAEEKDLAENILAVQKAVVAVETGTGTSFWQSDSGAMLRKVLSSKASMRDSDVLDLLAFVSDTKIANYAPQSGEIIGILGRIRDEMRLDLTRMKEAAKQAIADFQAWLATEQREVDAYTKTIEAKLAELSDLAVLIETKTHELEDAKFEFEKTSKLAADLQLGCTEQETAWEATVKMRIDELEAIRETIELLNEGDALDTFKKALPSPDTSFIQISKRDAKHRALEIIRTTSKKHGSSLHLDFITLALQGKKKGSTVVIEKIDNLTALLKREQGDDDTKKADCSSEIIAAEDEEKSSTRSVSDSTNQITAVFEIRDEQASAIEGLVGEIKALNESMAEATEQRNYEAEEFRTMEQLAREAKSLLVQSVDRLNKFYNNSPRKVRKHGRPRDAHIDKEPPPTAGAYSKKHADKAEVIQMINQLVLALDKQLVEAKTTENHAQDAYKQLMADAEEQRTGNSESLAKLTANQAILIAEITGAKEGKVALEGNLLAVKKKYQSLHASCDWVLEHYDERKKARTSEIDDLADAKAVLNGAKFD